MCMIKDPAGCTMVMILWSNGLYWLDLLGSTSLDHANIASGKMSISEAQHKLGHIAHAAIKLYNWPQLGFIIQTGVLQTVCKSKISLSTVSKRVPDMSYQICWVSALGPMGPCICQKYQWLLLCCCPNWRCSSRDDTLLSRKEKQSSQVLKEGWSVDWNPNGQPYQNNAQWLRGRIPIKRVNKSSW